jgi:hypothetical protein
MAGTTSQAHRDEIHHIRETLLKTSNTSAIRSPTARPTGCRPMVRGMAPKNTKHGMMTCQDALARWDRGTGHGKQMRQGLSRYNPGRHHGGGLPGRGGKRRRAWASDMARGAFGRAGAEKETGWERRERILESRGYKILREAQPSEPALIIIK